MVEVVDSDGSITISADILNFNQTGEKSINDIFEYQGKLYLATSFAIIEYDIDQLELEKEDTPIVNEQIDIVNNVQLYEISIAEQNDEIAKMKKPIDEVIQPIELELEQEDNTPIENKVDNVIEEKDLEKEHDNILEIIENVNIQLEKQTISYEDFFRQYYLSGDQKTSCAQMRFDLTPWSC